MSSDAGAPFAVVDPLPRGGLAIEASAGTGKTTALADLATRFLAESGVATSELLIVTFTRAATNELRARVRNRLIEVADRLEDDDHLATATGPGEVDPFDDPVVGLLASRDRAVHVRRLRAAAVEFDAATITTIHGFAVQVRSALGEAAGIDPEVKLVDEGDQIVLQTCADVLAEASASGRPAADLPTLSELGTAAMRAASRPDMVLEPHSVDQRATPAQLALRQLVEQSVLRLDGRRRRQGSASFDSVLVDLCGALTGPGSEAAVASLRRRYRVALIDEFQDTDPVQWRIFERLFGEPNAGTTLVVVGDPKQAIYGFRGGDIETYINAVKDRDLLERRSMHANWRSDVAALVALDVLFAGATFGDPSIRYVPVTAARPAQHRRLRDESGAPLPALSLRLAIDPGIRRTRTASQVVVAAGARAIEEDLVVRVRNLLDHATIPSAGEDGPPRPVRPQDIAVLVNRNDECTAFQSALADQGVPAVVAQGGNVLRSPAAQQMRWLLHALGRPSDPRRARTYALSWFGGWSAAELDSSVDADLASLQEDLRTWSEQLATHSVAEVLARVWSTSGVAAKVLSGPDGDRNMTDLDHVAELLHGSTPDGRAHVAGLLAFLDGTPEAVADTDVDADITARRVESDAEAVQIMTVWTAKGLEFPIVCLPTLWRWQGSNDPVIYVDPDTGRRTFDLARGTTWPSDQEAKARKERAARELAGERLRLLYVALTRARHQSIVWWANGQNSGRTALARALFGREGDGIDPDAAVAIPADDDVVDALSPLVEASRSTVAVSAISHKTPAAERWSGGRDLATDAPLGVAPFTARLDRSPRRWSFSAITDEPAVAGSDPFDPTAGDGGAGDERLGQEVGPLVGPGLLADHGSALSEAAGGDHAEGALFELPAGARFGTLVHAVLESIDFSVGPGLLEPALGAGIDRQLARQPMDLTPSPGGTADVGRSLLTEGLIAALRTPLGPLCASRRLVDLPPADLLREVSFDLRLGQGVRRPTVRDVGTVAVAHLQPDDPLVGWAERLAMIPTDLVLTGHLTGSIDLVLRIDDESGPSRFVVADYKTNALTLPGRTGRVGDYGSTRLAEAMASHDYPLQALLYLVALHRYLRWRLRDYRPTLHLGGAVYLFLRGMTGPTDGGTTEPAGVFSWPVPPALVVALSDLLEGRPVGESAP
jgi:exodeoxyribonuclease V beta subunit